jgi:hypothetical protein
MFFNGRLLGGAGDFRSKTPIAYSTQPRLFVLSADQSVHASEAVVAVRAWMGPWELADPQAGGMRIAPTFGDTRLERFQYQSQWLETFRGYIVEVVEALLFLAIAFALWVLGLFEQNPKKYLWTGLALILTAAYRKSHIVGSASVVKLCCRG